LTDPHLEAFQKAIKAVFPDNRIVQVYTLALARHLNALLRELPAADRELAIKTINTILTETSYKLIAENDNGELDSIIIDDQLLESIGVLYDPRMEAAVTTFPDNNPVQMHTLALALDLNQFLLHAHSSIDRLHAVYHQRDLGQEERLPAEIFARTATHPRAA
jgi:hypothetical protein